jgi:regulator of sigma E protease
MAPWYFVAALGVALLMVIHEAGHFFAARAYGMRVTKFSIGFGPTFFRVVPEEGFFWFTTAAGKIRIRLWKHNPEKHGPTIYQVGMIPFLAYVQIAGMNPMDEHDPNDKGSYANGSLGGRIVAIFGGPFSNYVFASVFIFLSLFFGGKAFSSTKINVLDGRPAVTEARLQNGDKILAIDGPPWRTGTRWRRSSPRTRVKPSSSPWSAAASASPPASRPPMKAARARSA